MEIVLVRHGKPTGTVYPKVNAKGFAEWVKEYDRSGIIETSKPDKEIALKYAEHYMISSDLTRAIKSAEICFNKKPEQTLNILKEIEIPKYKLPFILKVSTWLILNRVLWTLRINGCSESYSEATKRSKTASQLLANFTNTQGKTIVFGHGYMIYFIRKNLVKSGWSITEKSNRYWGVTRLVK